MWGTMMLSPIGALFCGLVDATNDLSKYVSNFPNFGATISFVIVESVLFMAYTYYTDVQSIAQIAPQVDPNFDESAMLGTLDEDVIAERTRTLDGNQDATLKVEHLRKVFPPKRAGQRNVVAVQDVNFMVEQGEIFGLLGANGAGKSTTLSMLTRHLIPTAGDAFVLKHSVLTEFSKATTHIGVVTQNNSLWDKLTVEAHLKLFARLRGVVIINAFLNL
jgi:ABC-type glutathione transport system ATPase component